MNFCIKCGGKNTAGNSACAFCGHQMTPSQSAFGQSPYNGIPPNNPMPNNSMPVHPQFGAIANTAPQQKQGLAITSLILGIIGFVLMCCGLGWIVGIPAIICGAMHLKRNKSGMAVAGLIMGIIATVIGLIMAIYWTYIFTSPEFWDAFEEAMNAMRVFLF
ncbi:MAG: DUF4190 domain-containing protein [Firmicutes bacterium]|nr:DUF4190 domain-containing protein [Bacillota bacterium]